MLVHKRTTDPHPYGVWSDWFGSVIESGGELQPISENFQSDKHHDLKVGWTVEYTTQHFGRDITLSALILVENHSKHRSAHLLAAEKALLN